MEIPHSHRNSSSQVQASEYPDFALHILGWKSFQDLVGTIGSEVFGQTFQLFLPSRDAGRDGAFRGTWKPNSNDSLSGSFIAQCKFSNKANAKLSMSDMTPEIEKARKLASEGLGTNYLLFTNCGISGASDIELKATFEAIPGIETFLSFGSDWITQKIRTVGRLRMLVPRIYGLGDLSQILDERQYSQAAEILSSMQHDLATLVITDAYRNSAKAILDYGFVFLLGDPASGKSTIAASLALGAIDNWKCSTPKIRTAAEFVKHWNPRDPTQFFWVDDVFGPNQYQGTSAQEWNSAFSHVNAAVKGGTKILFTSRGYIYRAALRDLKVSAFPLITESQVVINVQNLTLLEKRQILYNHIKLGNQSKRFKTNTKIFLPDVSNNMRFLPETARRLGNSSFTKNLQLSSTALTYFVEEPVEMLKETIRTLDVDSRSAIALIFMSGGSLASPVATSEPFVQKALRLLGGSEAGVRQALANMNGSFVKLSQIGGEGRWGYKHPTIGDAFAEIIADDPELIEIYVEGSPVEKIVGAAVCGDAKVEGAKLIIPRNFYDRVIRDLPQLKSDLRLTFLSERCDREFLVRYVELAPALWNEILAFTSIFPSPHIQLAARLQEFQILPREVRDKILNRVVELSADLPDSDFLHAARLRNLFTESEIDLMLNQVLTRLAPDIENLIDDWSSNFRGSGEEPDDFYSPLIDCLEEFYNRTSDPEWESVLRTAIASAEFALDDAKSDYRAYHQYDDYERYDYGSRSAPIEAERNIFEDVDQ